MIHFSAVAPLVALTCQPRSKPMRRVQRASGIKQMFFPFLVPPFLIKRSVVGDEIDAALRLDVGHHFGELGEDDVELGIDLDLLLKDQLVGLVHGQSASTPTTSPAAFVTTFFGAVT